MGLDAIPEPDGKPLARGVFQTGHFVQVVVIQMVFDDGFDYFGQFSEVDEPACVGVDGTPEVHGKPEAVTVQTFAFVTLGNIGQVVGGIKCESFPKFYDLLLQGLTFLSQIFLEQ